MEMILHIIGQAMHGLAHGLLGVPFFFPGVITNGQTGSAGDFISTSAGAGDSGKVPKLNGSGVLDDTFLASGIFGDIDQSQTTQNATQTVGTASTTTLHNKIAESFVPTVKTIRGVNMYKAADTGSFTGTVSIALQADSAGSPSGTDLASYTISNAVWLLMPVGAFPLWFSTEYASMTVGGTYWIVVTTSTADTSNHPNFNSNSAGGYASGVYKFFNTTDGWTAGTGDLYFATLKGIQSKTLATVAGFVPAAIAPSGILKTDQTASGTLAIGATTTVFKLVLPAGFFGVNTAFRVWVMWAWSNVTFNNFPSSTLTIGANGSAFYSSNAVDYSTSNGAGPSGNLFMDLVVTNNASVSAQNYFVNERRYSASTTSYAGANVGTTAVDLSGQTVITITIVNTGGTGHSDGSTSTYSGAYVQLIGR